MISLTEFKSLCEYLSFPTEALEALSADFSRILESKEASSHLSESETLYKSGNIPGGICQRQFDFEHICGTIQVNGYSAQMIFYIALIPSLREKYIQIGLPLSILDKSMSDLRCKLYECHAVYGIWGSFVAVWFARFFNFMLYGIGRLEFAPYRSEYDYESENGIIKKGESVIDVHIPSSGKLDHSTVLDSYKEAYSFFTNTLGLSPKAFVCESWLLFPKHREIIPKCKNIIDFMNDYETVIAEDDKDGSDLWRIFGGYDTSDIDKLPRDTYMRSQYAEFLKSGGSPGFAKGIIFIKDGMFK